MEIMDTIGSFIPLIVGSIFFALGANLVLHFYRFRAKSKRVHGRVTAIEKYVSRTRSSRGHSSQVFFRPIVEFTYGGETRTTFGPGVNEVRHKLNQKVPVLVNDDPDSDDIQAMLDDGLRVLLGSMFAAVGLGALVVYVYSAGGSPLVAIGVAGVLLAIGNVIANMLLNFSMPFAGDENAHPKEDSTLITTPQQFREEVSSHGFWGAIIAWGFMLLSLGILYGGYATMPEDARQMMAEDFGGFWDEVTSGHMKSSWEGPVILTGAGLFFFLASLRSVYYVRKKYGALLAR